MQIINCDKLRICAVFPISNEANYFGGLILLLQP